MGIFRIFSLSSGNILLDTLYLGLFLLCYSEIKLIHRLAKKWAVCGFRSNRFTANSGIKAPLDGRYTKGVLGERED